MKRLLATACAAVLLTGSLTACGGNNNTGATNDGATNDGANNTGPAGTSYSVPGQVRYSGSANQNGNTTARNRQRSDGVNDGRYTAYSDGTVSQGHGAIARDGSSQGNNQSRTGAVGSQGNNQGRTGTVGSQGNYQGKTGTAGTQNAMDNGSNAMRDIGGGVGSAMRDIGNGVGNAVRNITGQS